MLSILHTEQPFGLAQWTDTNLALSIQPPAFSLCRSRHESRCRCARAFAGGLVGQEPEPGRGYPSADWSFTGGNWSSSRYTVLDAVATDTVDRLGGAWVTPLPGRAASRATPVVEDGVIYLPGGANVFAFDARTGDPIWRWEPDPEAGLATWTTSQS